jgi:hypothetical protein
MDEQLRKAMEAAAEYVANDPTLKKLREQTEAMEEAGMSTDGPTPPPCNPEIFKSGKEVFVTSTIPSNAMECWVKQVAEKSGQPVDWHFRGGRAIVLALGDLEKVKKALNELMPEHDRLYQEAVRKLEF